MARLLIALFISVICVVTVLGQEGNCGLQVFYKPSLIAVINETAKMGVILDYSCHIIVDFNGKQGAIYVVDISNQVGYFLNNGTDMENSIWSNFEAYFEKLLSLQLLLETGQEKCEKSKLDTLEEPVRGTLEELFDNLGGTSSLFEELSLLTKFIEQLRGPLSLVYKGSGSFRIPTGVHGFTEVNLVFAEILYYSEGKLTPDNVNLNATQILEAENGLWVLLNVLSQVGTSFDLIKVFDGLFTSPKKVLSLLKRATRPDGLPRIIVNYMELFLERRSFYQLIISVLNYNPQPGDEQSLRSLANRTLAVLENQEMVFHNGFSIYISIMRDFNENDRPSKEISISDIITILTSTTSRNPLTNFLNIMSTFYRALNIPHLFGSITGQYNQTLDGRSSPGNFESQVIYKLSLIAIINKSYKMAVILDYSSRIIVLLNGKRCTIHVVDISEQERYYIKNETDTVEGIWSNFEDYFQELSSLQSLLETGRKKGEKTQLDISEESVRVDMEEVFNSLGAFSPLQEELLFLIKFIDQLKGLLSLLYKRSGSFDIAGGLEGFIRVNLAVADLLRYFEGNSDRHVFYKPSLIAIINAYTKMGLILDYSFGLMVVFNGNSSSIIVVDIYKQLRYYLENEADTVDSIWSNFEDYFQKLSSLQLLLKTGQEKGIKSELKDITEPVRKFLNEMFNGLDGSSPMPEDLSHPTKFIEQLKGSLSLVYKGSGSFRITSSLDGFTRMNMAVAELLNYSEVKLSLENLNLNATQIFDAGSVAQVLLNVLSRTGVRVDLMKVFGGLFTSPEKVLSLLKNANSGFNDGIDGLITILANYAELFIGRGSLDQLISSVLHYNAGPDDGESLNSLVIQTLTLLANQDRLFHNAPGFSVYVSILKGNTNNTHTSTNIRLLDIIGLLTSSSSENPLSNLVKVMSSFYQALNIPDSFGSITRQFNLTLDGGSTPGNSDLQVIYKPFLIAIFNESARMAVMLDYSSKIIAELNGKQATIQVVDISGEVRYSFKNDADTENGIWTDFGDYFQKQSSLKLLLKIGQEKGEKSSKYTLEEPIRMVLAEVFNGLGASSPLPQVLKLLTKFMDQLRGPLSLVYRGSASYRISGGVDGFIEGNLAVAKLLTISKENPDRLVFYKPSFIAIINKSDKIVVIFDYSARLVVVLNGKLSSVIVIDMNKQVRYYLDNEADIVNSIWFNFEDYFQKLSSLQLILKTGQEKGTISKLDTLEGPVRKALTEVFDSLDGPSLLPVDLSLPTKFVDQLNGPLSLMYKGSGFFRIASRYAFLKVNLAVAELLHYSKEKLSPENIKLDITQIFKAESSAEVLLNVLVQAGVRFDLIKLFGGLFTSSENILILLKNASSGSYDGLDGLLTILLNYAELFNGKGSIDQLISSVLNYNSRFGDEQSLRSLANQSLTLVANQDKLFHNAPGFSIFISIWNGIIRDNYSSSKISLSYIVSLLTSRSSGNPLSFLVKVISTLCQALNLPNPFVSIAQQFNQTLDGGSMPGLPNLRVIYKPFLIAIFNESAKMAVVFDYFSQIIAEMNGKQATIQVVDISGEMRYSFKYDADTEKSIWTDFEDHFRKQSSLQPLLKIGQEKGEKSSKYTLEKPVRIVLEEVFNSLGASSSLPEVLSLLIKFMDQLRGPLSLVYRGSGSYRISGGVDGFIEGNLAVAKLLIKPKEKPERLVFYKPSLIAIINKSDKIGVIFDYSARLVVVLNGKLSSVIVIDMNKQVRYYLDKEADTVNSIWFNFGDYFQKLSSLQFLLKIGQEKGKMSKLDTVEEPVRMALNEMFISLDGSIPLPEDLSLPTKFIEQLNGVLSLLYKGSGSFRIASRYTFLKINLAVAELLNYSVEKLSPEKVNLDATQIFETAGGAEVLLKVLSQVGVHFDLIKLFGGLFISPEKILDLLKNASSGSYDSLDGLLTILLNYAELFDGKGSIDQLITSILNYNSRFGDEQSLRSLVNQTLTLVANQDKLFHNAPGFSVYVSIWKGIINDNYISGKISLSYTMTLLTSRSSGNPLSTFVNVISSFYQALKIPDPFGSIKKQFNQTLDGGLTQGNSNYQVIYKSFLIAIVNKSAKMAVILDYSSHLIAELNGKQAIIQVVDISEKVRYSLKNDTATENSIWTDFEGYFQKQSSLQLLLKICQEKGVKSSAYTLEAPVRKVLEEVFNGLGVSSPLQEVLSLLTEFINQLKGPLSLVYRGSGSFRISGGLDAFIKGTLAVAKLLINSKGNPERLVLYKPSLIAIINKSDKIGVIFDYTSQLSTIINGKMSSIIVADISKQVRYYLDNEAVTLNNIWSNFEDYFQKLSSLEPLLKRGQEKGKMYTLDTLDGPVRKALTEKYISLDGSLPLSLDLSLPTKFIEQLNGPLALMFKGSGVFKITTRYAFLTMNLAVAELLNYSVEKFSPDNLNLDATQIFEAGSGAEVLLKVLFQAGVRYDLIKLFGGLFTSLEKILSILKNASSGSYDGLDGLLTILLNYEELFNGRGSIDQLISSVLNYNLRFGDEQSLRSLFNQTLTLVAKQDSIFHNAPGFSVYVSIWKGIINDNYTSGKISLSYIMTLLTSRNSRNPLSTFVDVISSFYQALKIPDPFGSIKEQFNQTLIPGNPYYQVIYKQFLIAIVNKSAKMALILDYSSHLIAELNGKQAMIQIVDIFGKVRYSLKNDTTTENSIWTDFESYFQKQSSLQLLLKICREKGEKSSAYTLEAPVRKVLEEVFNSLGISSPLPEVLSLLTKFIDQLKAPLSLVYRGSGSFRISGGLDGFIKGTLAVANLLINSKGNPERLVLYKPSLIAIINKSDKIGVIFDYSSRLNVVFNGKTSSMLVADINEQVRYYLENETNTVNSIWSNFEDYFQKLPSLQTLLKRGKEKGKMSKLDTLEEPIRKALNEMFISLDGPSLLPVELYLGLKFLEQLNSSLSLMYKGSGFFKIASRYAFLKVNLVVAELLNYSKEKLSPENINLDATQLFRAESGAEILLNVLSQAGIRFDLMKLFGGLFTSPEKILSLLKNASSGSYDGLDGLLTILLNYAELFNGKGSIDQLISSVLNYNLRSGDEQSLRSLVNQTLTLVANQDKLFHNAPGFSVYVSVWKGIINDNYISGKISLSYIMTLLTSGSSGNPLSTFVDVISSFYQALKIPDPFGSIKKQFNQTLDGGLIPGNSNYQVIYKPFIFAIVNKSAKMAVILDYSSHLIAELNGKQAIIQVVDVSGKVRHSLKNDTATENSIWTDFESYFQKQSSLQLLLKICREKGEKSSAYTLEAPVRKVLEELFNSLGSSSPLPEVLSFLTKFIEQLKGPLSLVYRGSGSFRISGGLDGFIKGTLAVANLLINSKENPDLLVFYKPSFMAIINESTKIGVIFDYSCRLRVVLNGKLFSIYVEDISKQVRYNLDNETETVNSIWSNFEDYFQKLSSLQTLLKTGQEKGKMYKLDTLEGPVRRALNEKFIDQLNGPLSLIYKGSGSFRIAGRFVFLKVNLAIAELLNYSKEKLSPENINLDATQIFRAESGAEVFLQILSQAGIRFDLMNLFGGLFTSPEKILSLLKNASSGSYDGLDGLLTILLNYAELFNGKGSIDQLISSVLNYNLRSGDEQRLRSLVNQTLTLVANQDKLFHNAAGFSVYVSIWKGIINDNYISGKISLSYIMTLLTSGSSGNPLSTFVDVLSSFYKALKIPDPFGSIKKQFKQTLDGGSPPGNSNNHVIYKPSLITIVNKSAKMAIILDYSSQLIAELNGKQAIIQVVDIFGKVRYSLKIDAATENSIWTDFEGYFQKQSSLQLLLKICREKGEKSSTYTLEKSVRVVLEEVFKSLGVTSPLPEVLLLLTKFTEQLKGHFSLMYKGSGSFKFAGGVDGFIKGNLAVWELLRNSKGSSLCQVFYKPSLIAIINKSARMGVILDYSSHIILELNGKRSTIHVVHISKQVRYDMRNEIDIEKSIWSNFEDYFQKLSSLHRFKKIGRKKGKESKLQIIEEPFRGALNEMFHILGGSSPLPEELALLIKFTKQMKGHLSLVYNGMGSFRIANGLNGFMKVNLALADLLHYSKRKILKNVNLNAMQLFEARSGAEVMLEVFSQAGVNFDLTKVFHGLFAPLEKILSLLKTMSSGSHDGLDGLFTILMNYLELFYGRGSIGQLISSVLSYNYRPGDVQSLSSVVNQTLTLLANQDKLFQNAPTFSEYLTILNGIIDDDRTSGKMSLSYIISLLTSGSSRNPLSTLVNVLSSAYQALNIPDAFGNITRQFNQVLDAGSTTGNSDLQVIYKPPLIAIYNETAKMAVILDYYFQIIAELNGKQAMIQVVDISGKVRYSMKNDAATENSIWTDFEGYFQKQSSLQLLLKIGKRKGEKSSKYTLEEPVRVVLEEVFKSLGASSPLLEVLSLLVKFIEQLKHLLFMVYKGSGSFRIAGGVDGFIQANLAVERLLSSSMGSAGGGDQECESGGKGVGQKWWKRRGPFPIREGGGGDKKGDCGIPLGVSWDLFGGRGNEVGHIGWRIRG